MTITVDLQDISWLGWQAAILCGWQRTYPKDSIHHELLEVFIEELIAGNSLEMVIADNEKYLEEHQDNSEYCRVLREVVKGLRINNDE